MNETTYTAPELTELGGFAADTLGGLGNALDYVGLFSL
ncbi:lasso RiPP family leader peptide-containing protein [Saccharopolyspora sp. CA-218241]